MGVGCAFAVMVSEHPDTDMRPFWLEKDGDVDQLAVLGTRRDELSGMGWREIPMRLRRQPQNSPQPPGDLLECSQLGGSLDRGATLPIESIDQDQGGREFRPALEVQNLVKMLVRERGVCRCVDDPVAIEERADLLAVREISELR